MRDNGPVEMDVTYITERMIGTLAFLLAFRGQKLGFVKLVDFLDTVVDTSNAFLFRDHKYGSPKPILINLSEMGSPHTHGLPS